MILVGSGCVAKHYQYDGDWPFSVIINSVSFILPQLIFKCKNMQGTMNQMRNFCIGSS